MSLISLVSQLKRCESDKGCTQVRGGNCKDCTMEVIQIYGKIQVARTADGCSSSSWFRCHKCSLVVRNHLVNQKKKVAKKTYLLLESHYASWDPNCHLLWSLSPLLLLSGGTGAVMVALLLPLPLSSLWLVERIPTWGHMPSWEMPESQALPCKKFGPLTHIRTSPMNRTHNLSSNISNKAIKLR